MDRFTLTRVQYLRISADAAWAFFSSAKNLAKITPPELGFKILSQLKDEPVHSGLLIEYRVSPVLGIPMKWITEITGVNAPVVFTDKQLKGPYAVWEHTHRFTAVPGGVKMTDEVKYSLPLGWLGRLAHTLFVRKKLEQIFNYRSDTLKQLFGELEIS